MIRKTNPTAILMKTRRPISPFRLSSLLRLQKEPKLALLLFLNPNPTTPTSSEKPFRYSLISYDLIISKLGRAKMFDEMEKVLLQLKQETRFAPREILFCNVISFYGRARLSDQAFRVYELIPSFLCQRTVKSLNSLLDALLKCRKFEKMRELFLEFIKYETPDACTYNILIHASCLNGNLDDAHQLFDEMCNKEIHPNVVTFGTLIYGLCLSSKLDEALKLKLDMERDYGVCPNAFVYTTLIKGLCGIGKLSSAFKLKEEMITRNIKLDSTVYSTLISGLFKVGRKGEVYRLLDEMGEKGCKPDSVTYNAMINGFCKDRDFELAFKILDQMAEKGCKPGVISFNVIIANMCKEGKWSEASELLEDMPRRGCYPDVVSFRSLFDGLCENMRFKEAASILDEMIFKNYLPLGSSVNKLVDRLCVEGEMDLLLMVLDTLGKGNAINAEAWGMVISIVCKENLSKMSDFVDELIGSQFETWVVN